MSFPLYLSKRAGEMNPVEIIIAASVIVVVNNVFNCILHL